MTPIDPLFPSAIDLKEHMTDPVQKSRIKSCPYQEREILN